MYPFVKWWWLLLIALVVSAISSFVFVRNQPPIYEAKTTLMAGRAITNPNPNDSDFYLGQQLADMYVTLAQRDPMIKDTEAALGLEELPEFNIERVSGSSFIEIKVVDTSPERAQAVANELANQLIKQSPSAQSTIGSPSNVFIEQQLTAVQENIQQTEQELIEAQDELGKLNSARQIAAAQEKIAALQTKLASLQNNYTELLASTRGGASNALSIIEAAELPVKPIGPNKPAIILMASALGLLLGASAALLVEHLDTTLNTPADIKRVLNLPVLGFIADMDKEKETWAYAANHPRTPVSEAFRSLYVRLQLAAKTPPKLILLASPEAAEGKTTVAGNLALVIAQAGERVALVEADLHRTENNLFMDAPNTPGLSEVISGKKDVFDVLTTWKDERIVLLPAGNAMEGVPGNINPHIMTSLFESLETTVDKIIIDGPPFFMADAITLAPLVEAVIIVIRSGHTREDVARAMLEQLQMVEAPVLGVVFNRIPHKAAVSFGGYHVYSPRYAHEEKSKKAANKNEEEVIEAIRWVGNASEKTEK